MKKLILLLLFIPFLSCNQDIKNKVTKEINSSQIPAVVMGKIDKNGNMEFFSNGPSRWDRNDTINENNIFRIASMTKALGSVAALQLVEQGKITLDEPLDDYLPEMTSRKIIDLSVDNLKPIGFGILTCYNLDQAINRSDINQKNKGREAALACIDLLK